MIDQPLTLPCGAEIPNRLCKAAMTEGLASPAGEPTAALNQLYGLWSDGGAGLLLSGNVQIDGDHLERPGNVIVEGEPSATMQAALEAWAAAGTRGGNHFWAQISHAGRQCQRIVNPHPKAPSAVKLGLPGGQFGEPDPMTEEDIEGVIAGFARCAKVLVNAGFTGVQLHAAHGYLLSQFLSPRSNQREDHWGGPLENRARLLMSCVARVRAAVGPAVPVSVKLNSADFQRGGFDFNESLQVAQWLEQASVDLIEISGGTYEQPRLLNLEGMGMIGVPGVAQRLFGALERVGTSVLFIAQASSEQSICFGIPQQQMVRARDSVLAAFFKEIHDGHIHSVDVVQPVAIIAAVGDNMINAVGVSGAFFNALSAAQINVLAISQGSSQRNISAVVMQDDAPCALRAVHTALCVKPHKLAES